MPVETADAMAFLKTAEDNDRKNARVVDKIMLALPRELDAEQRAALVRHYAEVITQGRASWLAAFHDRGKDADNPHCHLIIRDRDVTTGKRVAGLSEKGSTERLRTLWEECANNALAEAGHAERIDRRTLEAQGVERAPTIHEGVRARRMERQRRRPRSRSQTRRNAALAKRRSRIVEYEVIDNGRTRAEHNEALRRRANESASDYWAAVDLQRQSQEIEILRTIHRPRLSPDEQRQAKAVAREHLRAYVERHSVTKSPDLSKSHDLENEPDD